MNKVWVSKDFQSVYPSLDSLRKLVDDVAEAEANGTWKNFTVEIRNNSYYDGDGDYEIVIVGLQLETDAEFAKRIKAADKRKAAIAKAKAAIEANERAQYEKLKVKLKVKFEPALTSNNSSGQKRPGA